MDDHVDPKRLTVEGDHVVDGESECPDAAPPKEVEEIFTDIGEAAERMTKQSRDLRKKFDKAYKKIDDVAYTLMRSTIGKWLYRRYQSECHATKKSWELLGGMEKHRWLNDAQGIIDAVVTPIQQGKDAPSEVGP